VLQARANAGIVQLDQQLEPLHLKSATPLVNRCATAKNAAFKKLESKRRRQNLRVVAD
jgi:hypothetical protein